MAHKIVSKILHKGKTVKTKAQKYNTPTQKRNKHTPKKDNFTPKYSKLTPKNTGEQGGKLLKENGSDISESVSEKACKRGQAEKKKIALAQKFGKTLLEPKNKNLRGERGGRRTAQSHALQKEIL